MSCQKNGIPTVHYRMNVDVLYIYNIHTAIEWAGANHKIGQIIILPKDEKRLISKEAPCTYSFAPCFECITIINHRSQHHFEMSNQC